VEGEDGEEVVVDGEVVDGEVVDGEVEDGEALPHTPVLCGEASHGRQDHALSSRQDSEASRSTDPGGEAAAHGTEVQVHVGDQTLAYKHCPSPSALCTH